MRSARSSPIRLRTPRPRYGGIYGHRLLLRPNLLRSLRRLYQQAMPSLRTIHSARLPTSSGVSKIKQRHLSFVAIVAILMACAAVILGLRAAMPDDASAAINQTQAVAAANDFLFRSLPADSRSGIGPQFNCEPRAHGAWSCGFRVRLSWKYCAEPWHYYVGSIYVNRNGRGRHFQVRGCERTT